MNWCYEIVCTGTGRNAPAEARAWVDEAASVLGASADVSALDLYVPATGEAHDPFNNDGPGPALLAMLACPSREALARVLDDADFARAIAAMPDSLRVTGTAQGSHDGPGAGHAHPTRRVRCIG